MQYKEILILVVAAIIMAVGFVIEWHIQGKLREKDEKTAKANNYQI